MDESSLTNSPDDNNQRVEVLFDKLVDQSLSTGEFQEFEQLLSRSETLRWLFAERMSLEVGIAGWGNACEPVELLDTLAGLPATLSFDPELEPIVRRKVPARSFFSGTITRPWAYGFATATCLAIVAFFNGWWNIDEPGAHRITVVGGNVPTADSSLLPSDSVVDSRDTYIGRVRALSAKAVWRNEDFLTDFLLRIEPGEQLTLEQGLAEIELKSGVTITLHGDTSYTFTSGEQGVLNHGTISAHTKSGGYTTKFGGMLVRSLGDEADYAVVSNGTNKVAVSQGEVSVINDKKKRTTAPVLLGPGRVVYVSAAGKLTGTNDRPDPSHNQQSIARSSYRPPQGVLSLVDIVSGGNGLGANLAGMVDAASGNLAWRDMQDEPLLRLPDGQFNRGQGSQVIDGTFVASRDSEQLQVSSAGHTTTGVKARGGSRGIIWARRPLPSGKLKQTRLAMMDDSQFVTVTNRLKKARDGAVGISANTGITFDLAKSSKSQNSPILAFQTLVRTLDSDGATNSMHLLVIVDGEIRSTTTLLGQDERDQKVRVSLSPTDRYLTLFVAAEGNEETFGQAVLFDPMLIHRNAEHKP